MPVATENATTTDNDEADGAGERTVMLTGGEASDVPPGPVAR